MSGMDLYAVALKAKSHVQIVNRNGQERELPLMIQDEQDIKIPQINATKYAPENYMEMREKCMKKKMQAAVENQEMAIHEREMKMVMGCKPHSAGVEADEESRWPALPDHDPKLSERDMLIRRGRIAILELINENQVNLRYAPMFLKELVEQAQSNTPDHAQYFLQQIIDEQTTNLVHADGNSLKELIKLTIPMDKRSVTQMWIKEYKEMNPRTNLTDHELQKLANNESIFQEMTTEQMQQYNEEQSQRLQMNIFLYDGLVNGVLLAFGCLMLSSALDFVLG